MKSWMLLLLVVLAVPACSNTSKEVKSPCVGAEDSPCGPKRSVNAWWQS